jgi:hypothetical protein
MKYKKQGSQNLKVVVRYVGSSGVLRVGAVWEVGGTFCYTNKHRKFDL